MENKKRKIKLTIVGVLLLFAISIGITYSFYVAQLDINNQTQTGVETTVLGFIYNGTREIRTGDKMIPGDSFEKTFNVESTVDNPETFNIYMDYITNEFNEDLVYTLYEVDANGENPVEVVSETPLPVTGDSKSYLKTSITLNGHETKYYKIKIEFKYLENVRQSQYKGKYFKATIGIDGRIDSLDDRYLATVQIPSLVPSDKVNVKNTDIISDVVVDGCTNSFVYDDAGNLRYNGANPCNYVDFNNELWRIVGIFDVDDGSGTTSKRVKLVRETPIGFEKYDFFLGCTDYGDGLSNWEQAELNTYLNYTYYKSLSKIHARDFIDDAVWNLGSFSYGTASEYYTAERSNNVWSGTTFSKEIHKTNEDDDEEHWFHIAEYMEFPSEWIGKVALIYPSDFGYAGLSSCYDYELENYSQCEDSDSNWFVYNNSDYRYWTLTPIDGEYENMNVTNLDYVDSNPVYDEMWVLPAVYMKSNVKIVGGNGSKNSPYRIAIKDNN